MPDVNGALGLGSERDDTSWWAGNARVSCSRNAMGSGRCRSMVRCGVSKETMHRATGRNEKKKRGKKRKKGVECFSILRTLAAMKNDGSPNQRRFRRRRGGRGIKVVHGRRRESVTAASAVRFFPPWQRRFHGGAPPHGPAGDSKSPEDLTGAPTEKASEQTAGAA
jgi:hypothetical protein